MTLFGSNLKATILAYEALFSAAGFDFAANASNPDSLKLAIAARESAARAAGETAAGEAILKAAGLVPAEGKSAAETVKAALDSDVALLGIYSTGLAAAGITPKPAKEGAALTADDIKTAVEARASQKAAATVAATGHAPLAIAPTAGDEIPATLAEIQGQLATTRDPVKAGKLAAQANALRDKARANPGNN
jgi:hypothetical protein